MRAKPLSTSIIRYKTLIYLYSQFTIRRVQNFHVRDFSQAIYNSIHDNIHYMEDDVSRVYKHDQIMLNPTPKTYLPGASL
jgi:uncharacterized membrane protein